MATRINLTPNRDNLLLTQAGAFEIYAHDGNDIVRVSVFNTAGDLGDYIDGGAGNDTLIAAGTDDTLIGGTGNDILRGNDGNDTLDGGDDDDVVDGGSGNDVLRGGTGSDALLGGSGNDSLDGGDGLDTLLGSFGNDTLNGGAGDDTLDGGLDNDTLDGGAGNDMVLGGSGNNILRGGAGNDTLIALSGADQLFGEDGDDEIHAGSGNDLVDGGAGNDTMLGEAGDDTILGGDGNDALDGGDGNDVLDGGTGGDSLVGGAGADALDGGAGVDTADYSASPSNIIVDLRPSATTGLGTGLGGHAQGDTLTNIENVVGTGFDDGLIGNASSNRLDGGAGNDQIDGREGDDTLVGGLGADLLIGNSGSDTADYSTSTAAVTARLNGAVIDPLLAQTGSGGDAEGDVLLLVERLVGSGFSDTLIGDEFNNSFLGGVGADVITGGDGSDTAEYSTSAAGVLIALGNATGDFAVAVARDNDITDGDDDSDAAGDQLTGIENLVGSAFADRLDGNSLDNRLAGGAGADVIRGLGGTDTADYSTSAAGVQVAILGNNAAGQAFSVTQSSTGDASGDSLSSIENLIGSAFNDVLRADRVGATVTTTNNRLDGGAGNDILSGGAGADILIGGDGIDTADYSTSTGGVLVQLVGPGLSSTGVGGDAAGDTISGTIENVTGSALSDDLRGSALDNVIRSGAATTGEILRGGSGADLLIADGSTTGTRSLVGSGINDGGVDGMDTYRSLSGFNVIQGYQAGERIELDDTVAARGLVASGGNFFWRLDSDTTAGNGGATTETWVLIGAQTSLSAAQALAIGQTLIDPNVFVDHAFV